VIIFSTGVRLNREGLIVLAISYFSFLVWYYVFSIEVLKFIVDISSKIFLTYNMFFNFLVSFTLILISSFIRRIDKTPVIYIWSVLSFIGMIFIILAPTDTFKLAIYFLLGVVFGTGLQAFFTIFWDLTVPEERGRVAGLIGLSFLPIFALIIPLARNLDFFKTAILCIILNLGTLAIRPSNAKKITMLTAKKDLGEFNPEKRTILLYSIPWAIFSLINATLAKVVSFHISQYFFPPQIWLWILQIVAGGFGAIIGGVIADFFGRKYSLGLGLTLYGTSSAISGLANTCEVSCFVVVGTGLAWGIFLVLFSFVIWGDLADIKTCARRYSIGLATFYFCAGIGVLLSPELLQVPLVVASTISSLLIFLSNVPLILAPEVLPLDFREKIRLELYIYLVKRKKPKYLSNQG